MNQERVLAALPAKHLLRRDFLTGSASGIAVASLAVAGLGSQITHAAESMEHMHDINHMHDNKMHHSVVDPKRRAVIDSAMDCVKFGRECAHHCVEMFQSGDQTMKDCYAAVQELVVSCNALAEFAVQDSRHLREFMQVCTKVCESCEKVCKKYEKDYKQCKDCAASCNACLKACNEYLK